MEKRVELPEDFAKITRRIPSVGYTRFLYPDLEDKSYESSTPHDIAARILSQTLEKDPDKFRKDDRPDVWETYYHWKDFGVGDKLKILRESSEQIRANEFVVRHLANGEDSYANDVFDRVMHFLTVYG
jgi:hypothetical protein